MIMGIEMKKQKIRHESKCKLFVAMPYEVDALKRIFGNIMLVVGCGLMLTACGSGITDYETISGEPVRVDNQEVERTTAPTAQPTASPGPTTTPVPTTTPTITPSPVPTPANPYDFTICFAGDINLDDNWYTMQFLEQQENGIYDCISPELMEHMQQADVMCLNNEFTYTTRGERLEGKLYHFRAKPERVQILQEMGVDIVKLANNHAFDYGEQGLLDTLETLEGADIAYMGAGRNLAEAMEPVYLEVDGKTVAFVAASRAEKNIKTPQATEEAPGILRCYDTALFLETITEARKNADFVIAYVHWGTEYSYDLEEVQLTTGKEYLDAGADVIIGAHSHCLQGMEYYDSKPIVYSLGNYWFNEKTLDTMLVDLHFYGDDENAQLEVKVIPAVQSGCQTKIVKEAPEQERIYSFLEKISVNVDIDEEGYVLEKE